MLGLSANGVAGGVLKGLLPFSKTVVLAEVSKSVPLMAEETSWFASRFSSGVMSSSEVILAGVVLRLGCSATHSGDSLFSLSGSWSNLFT